MDTISVVTGRLLLDLQDAPDLTWCDEIFHSFCDRADQPSTVTLPKLPLFDAGLASVGELDSGSFHCPNHLRDRVPIAPFRPSGRA